MLLPQLTLLDHQLRDVGRRIRKILTRQAATANEEGQTLPHAGVLLSIPGVGPVVAATLLAEATRPIRERDYQALRCYAGTAPITKQSAKRKTVNMRQACNPRLRQAVHYWASTSINRDERSRQHYDALRASATTTRAPCAVWPIGFWECSLPCSNIKRLLVHRDVKTVLPHSFELQRHTSRAWPP